MGNIIGIRDLCQGFIDHKYGIEELQQRLQTVNFPDEFYQIKKDIINALEEIRFTKLESNHYKYVIEVITKLVERLDEVI